jgi:arylformamidase
MITYPGDPEVRLERVSSIGDGDVVNLSRLDLGVHSGTHVDAPLHFLEGGTATEELRLEVLVGPCEVVERTGVAERVLVKRASRFDGAAAQRLVDEGVQLVGVDQMSVGDEDAHRVLLGAGVVVVEGLDLSGVEPGPYELYCLPLKLVGSDGAPARVFLVRGLG